MSLCLQKLLRLTASASGLASLLALPGNAGSWISNVAPGNVGLALLMSDGSVLAQKGPGYSNWFRLYPDNVGHYANPNNWSTAVAPMPDNRQFFSSDVLPSGKVFVAGGEYGGLGSGNRAAIYDPVANNWTPINVPASVLAPGFTASDGLNAGFRDSPSIVLADGTVLIVPIFPATNNTAAIYNPKTDTWSITPPALAANSLNEAGLNKLPDGSILAIDKNSATTERYIPSLGTWIADGTMPINIYSTNSEIGASLLLTDGIMIFFGGTGSTAYYHPSGGTAPGTWTIGPNIPGGLVARDAPAALLPNGNVLCAFTPATSDKPIYFYEFNPSTAQFTAQLSPNGFGAYTNSVSDQCAMLVLPDGNILFTDASSPTVYIYQPSSVLVQQSWKPVIQSYSFNPDGTIHITGTQFNGLSQGATFGDDNQMDSNYPLVKFYDTLGNVSFGTSFNWSSTGVQTGNQIVSTECRLPANVLNDTSSYTIQIVANGISSDPIVFTGPTWVQFGFGGSPKLGTFANPYSTLAQGIAAVPPRGEIILKPGLSHETLTNSSPMTITSWNGNAIIGQ